MLDRELDAQLPAEAAAGCFVLVGVVAQPVVEVQREDRIRTLRRRKPRSQTGRVGAAGDQGDDARPGLDQPAVANDLG